MTDGRMALLELVRKSGEPDFLRELLELTVHRLMEYDVAARCGAGPLRPDRRRGARPAAPARARPSDGAAGDCGQRRGQPRARRLVDERRDLFGISAVGMLFRWCGASFQRGAVFRHAILPTKRADVNRKGNTQNTGKSNTDMGGHPDSYLSEREERKILEWSDKNRYGLCATTTQP